MVPGRSTHSQRHAADCARRGQQRTDLEVVTPIRGSPTTHRRPAEVDPGIAAQARRNLDGLGLDPLVITDDGEQGHPAAGPHDRIVATPSVRRIPRAWLDQLRPGGVLLAPSTAPSAATCWHASPVRAAQPPEGTSWRTSSSCTSASGARPVHTQSWDGPRPPASSAGRSCRSRRGLVASRSLPPPRRDPPRGESERRAPPRNLQASDAPIGSQGRRRTWWWSGQVW
ncbi:hypothetical protein AB0J03_38225 [Streptomyces microflavus]|uniref:protein-L-isoaspartate O-methyltransferase family protein n=1 Tax=Streptomyces microflavus TaxID=1919 RepID=UPI003403FC36